MGIKVRAIHLDEEASQYLTQLSELLVVAGVGIDQRHAEPVSGEKGIGLVEVIEIARDSVPVVRILFDALRYMREKRPKRKVTVTRDGVTYSVDGLTRDEFVELLGLGDQRGVRMGKDAVIEVDAEEATPDGY